MQPLITVDHESRHNSYRAEDETPRSAETTPLLHRFPPPNHHSSSHFTTAVVSLLLIILISGVIIGIYLLIVQNNSENVLPPLNNAFKLVSRSQWSSAYRPLLTEDPPPPRATQVIVVQTDSESCYSKDACAHLLDRLQANTTKKLLPYNFCVSSSGETYEGLGWQHRSYIYPTLSASSLILGFIGNFTQVPPTDAQVEEAKNFFAASVSMQRLVAEYRIIGKKTKETPTLLFSSLKTLPQWDSTLSDT